MGLHFLIIMIPFLFMAFFAMWLAGTAWRSRRYPGSLSFTLLMLAIIVWLFGSALKEISPSLIEKVFWLKVQFFGVAWAATLWLTFAIDFAYPQNTYVDRKGGWLWVMPIATILVAVSNDALGWMWKEIALTPDGTTLVLIHGWWFWLFFAYSYLLVTAGVIVLSIGVRHFPVYHRRQVGALLVGLLIPWTANIGYIAGWMPMPGIDLTPLAFAFSGALYAWGLFRLGLFDSTLLAREAILEYIGEGYIVLDSRQRIVDLNEKARDLLSLGDSPYLRQPAETVLSAWPELVELSALNVPTRTEIPSNHRTARFIEVRITPWFASGRRFAGQIMILYDITARKQVEERLRDSEQQHRLLVTASPVGISLADKAGKITFASPEAHHLFQAAEGQLIGKEFLELVHPEDRASAAASINKVIENNERVDAQEYRLLRPGGDVIWGEISSAPMIDRNGNPKGLLSITQDVTERKMLEFDLQRNLAQQTFINDLLKIIYRPRDLQAAICMVLERTGEYTGASRIYVCKDSDDGTGASIFQEWCRPGIVSRPREKPLIYFPAMPSMRHQMESGGRILANLYEQPADDVASFMHTWDVQSFVALPVFGSEERRYGFMGFDLNTGEKTWQEEDLDLLWNVCRIVSGSISKMQTEEAESREKALVDALRDTAGAMNSTLNLDEVFDQVLANLVRVVPHDAASIAMIDDDQMVRFIRWRGYDEAGQHWMRSTRIPLDERKTYQKIVDTSDLVYVHDAWEDVGWARYPEFAWVRSFVGVPILIKGKVAGLINLDSRLPDFFTPDMSNRLRAFADQAAIAIENARLYAAAKRRADEMAILNRIGLTLTAGLEMNQVLVSLFEQCRQVLPIDVFSVALYEEESGMIDHALYYRDGEFPIIEPRNIHTSPGMSGEVIRKKKTIYLPDAADLDTEEAYQSFRTRATPTRSYVGVPLILLDRVVGVISMQNTMPRAYSADQVELLETIATQAAIAVQNARLYDQMKQLAITDPVTLLTTRRHFTTLGHREIDRALRYNRSLSVIMIDIDHFKRVNDTYGHYAGDFVLQTVARVCRQALRTTDIVGRWGGEEFVVVLPEADLDGARMIAERIRRTVENYEVNLPQGGKMNVTISLGVASLGPPNTTLELLVDCADRGLYAAKGSGRNQVKVCVGDRIL